MQVLHISINLGIIKQLFILQNKELLRSCAWLNASLTSSLTQTQLTPNCDVLAFMQSTKKVILN